MTHDRNIQVVNKIHTQKPNTLPQTDLFKMTVLATSYGRMPKNPT